MILGGKRSDVGRVSQRRPIAAAALACRAKRGMPTDVSRFLVGAGR